MEHLAQYWNSMAVRRNRGEDLWWIPEEILGRITISAGEDLSTHEYRFVKISAGKIMLCEETTDLR